MFCPPIPEENRLQKGEEEGNDELSFEGRECPETRCLCPVDDAGKRGCFLADYVCGRELHTQELSQT